MDNIACAIISAFANSQNSDCCNMSEITPICNGSSEANINASNTGRNSSNDLLSCISDSKLASDIITPNYIIMLLIYMYYNR